MPNVVIISGSPNPSSRLTGLLRHIERKLIAHNAFGGHIDVASLPAADLIGARFDSPAITQAAALIGQADAVVVASPVYKASYTGVLKTFLDLLPQKALDGKRVAPVLIGGTIAHLLAIEFQLKPVLGALGARHFAAGVYAVDTQVTRIEEPDGAPSFVLEEELQLRLDASVQELLEGLEVAVHA